MSDATQGEDRFYDLSMETDMDRMVERAIASLVERGKRRRKPSGGAPTSRPAAGA